MDRVDDWAAEHAERETSRVIGEAQTTLSGESKGVGFTYTAHLLRCCTGCLKKSCAIALCVGSCGNYMYLGSFDT